MTDLKSSPMSIPGVDPEPGREYQYLQADDRRRFESLFDAISEVLRNPNARPKSGGMIAENTCVVTPPGLRFFGLSYKGDLKGWRDAVVTFAQREHCVIAQVRGVNFELSDGTEYPLADCSATTYR